MFGSDAVNRGGRKPAAINPGSIQAPYFVLAPPFVFCSDDTLKNRLALKT
jgi:hypothetical protein